MQYVQYYQTSGYDTLATIREINGAEPVISGPSLRR